MTRDPVGGGGIGHERVAAAARAWLWYPDDAVVVHRDDLVVVRWPDYFAASGPGVLRLGGDTPTPVLLDEALALARRWGAGRVTVWVTLDAPPDLEPLLAERAARLDETLDVFALDLTGPLPSLDVPGDLELGWQRDPATTREVLEIGMAAFGEGSIPPEAKLAELGAEADASYRAGRGGSVLARLAGRAVAAGGLAVAEDVARLWGGGVVPDARGRGAYRGVLAERLRYAVEHGCTLALVKGRVETSGPVLRRAGFAAYGQERSYTLPVG
ncbi:MAG TPA: hypothetical protein VFT75_14580 [Nocardioidaceae bacterium]|nr:hypothetical protein [Nocardioidaceae bacterium]